jgi:hypothetical protein
MTTLPDNIIPLLLDGRSNMKASFKEFSDDQLRLGLMQLVDCLERMDELSYLVRHVSETWRKDKEEPEAEWEKVAAAYISTPLVAPSIPETPWINYQVADLQEKQCTIENLPRADLEAAIRVEWNALKRFHVAAKLLSRDASRIMSGEWIQDEGEKPEPEHVSPSPRRRRP